MNILICWGMAFFNSKHSRIARSQDLWWQERQCVFLLLLQNLHTVVIQCSVRVSAAEVAVWKMKHCELWSAGFEPEYLRFLDV